MVSDIAHFDKAFHRRVKRHMIGQEHLFFAATAPGLERLCMSELREIMPDSESITCLPGGVEFKGRLADCYRANLHSRTASRVLLRIKSFKVTNFSQLKRNLFKLPWELYLSSDQAFTFKISSKQSRLYHTGAVENQFHHAISERLAHHTAGPAERSALAVSQTVYIRIVSDRVFISLDSSGDHLYRRGVKQQPAKAPIRETLAAAAIKMAGHVPCEPIVDPMCGSGTFAIEAAMMAGNIPAGWFREFAFKAWPAFRPQQWGYIRKQAAKAFNKTTEPTVFASDNDAKSIHQLERQIECHGLSNTIHLRTKDFFDIHPKSYGNKAGLVIINPPYGRRLVYGGNQKRFYKSIFNKLIKDFSGWKMGLMIPDKALVELCPFKVESHPLFHGGLKLTLITGRIP